MKFTDTQITIDHISKIPVEAAGALKGFTTPNAIGVAIDNDILSISQTVSLQSALDTLQDNIDDKQTSIELIQTDIINTNGRIDDTETSITFLDGRIDDTETSITILDGRIDGNDISIASINNTLLTKANKNGGNIFTGHQLFATTEQQYTDFILGASPVHKEGRLFYDNVDKSLGYYVDDAHVLLNIGREMWLRVKNNTSMSITDGAVVYIKDAADGYSTVELALANSLVTSRVIGVATHTIGPNSFGYVTLMGAVKGLNTAAYADGDILYLSSTIPGTMQKAMPATPNLNIRVGFVEFAHPSEGKIFVHPETHSIPSNGIFDGTASATPDRVVVRSSTGGANFVELGASGNITLSKTITPDGTTGNRTIHTNSGSVNFARNMTSLTVINNRVTPDSIILISKATNDNSAQLGAVVANTGNFVIHMDHNPGGECRVNFLITN